MAGEEKRINKSEEDLSSQVVEEGYIEQNKEVVDLTEDFGSFFTLEWDGFSGDIDIDDIQLDNIELSDEKEEIYSSKNFIKQETESYVRFDEEFHCFLSNFVVQQKDKEDLKQLLKKWFFGLIMAGFFALLITPLVIVLKSKGITTGALVTALLTTLVELVSAIIVLPKIIAEYLFNKEEDKNMMEIIKSMQTYNEKKQDYIERQK